ncbi:MAG: phosphoribosylaminoimidazolesuccinocarboxamide synthase [archaeon]
MKIELFTLIGLEMRLFTIHRDSVYELPHYRWYRNPVKSIPDQNAIIEKNVPTIPLSFVVTGYFTQRLNSRYIRGEKLLHGVKFNTGQQQDQKIYLPLVLPYKKTADNKAPTSREEILSEKIITERLYDKIEDICIRIYERANKLCNTKGLIVAEANFEFGIVGEELFIVGELLTPQTADFWTKDKYLHLFKRGLEQERPHHKALFNAGIDITEPKFIDDDLKIDIAKDFINFYSLITDKEFFLENYNVLERLKKNIAGSGFFSS